MKPLAALLLLFAFMTGCAALRGAPEAEITLLPVVRVGDAPPPAGEYVIFYPAGYAFPARLTLQGTLFKTGQEVETSVALTRDLYLYKSWASHDGKRWENSHRLMEVAFSGGFDRGGAHAFIRLDTTR